MSFITKDIAIDLGTTQTSVFLKDKGIIFSEPTVIAINEITNEILAVGKEAKEMIGRTPDSILAVRPIEGGVISNFKGAQKLLEKCIKQALGKHIFCKARVLMCIPATITDVELRAIEEIAYSTGAKEVYTIEQSMAAAIGAGLKIEDSEGTMIINIGGGVTETSVISSNGIVASNSIKCAGDTIDKDIIEYIREKYNILIGECVAEEIKNTLGTAITVITDERMQIKGRNLLTGLPDAIVITTKDVEEAMGKTLNEVVKLITLTLEKTSPELVADITKNGITVCGGGANIKNIDRLITNKTGLAAWIADNPTECVIKGLSKSIENINIMKKCCLKR